MSEDPDMIIKKICSAWQVGLYSFDVARRKMIDRLRHTKTDRFIVEQVILVYWGSANMTLAVGEYEKWMKMKKDTPEEYRNKSKAMIQDRTGDEDFFFPEKFSDSFV